MSLSIGSFLHFSYSFVYSKRNNQITFLKTCFPNVREVSKDNTFDIEFETHQKGDQKPMNLVLRVYLSPSFPATAPVFFILPKGVKHPLLSERDGAVISNAHPYLKEWNVQHRVDHLVVDLVSFFISNPPAVNEPVPVDPPIRDLKYPNAFPEIDKLQYVGYKSFFNVNIKHNFRLEEIENLLSDDELLQSYFESLESIKLMEVLTSSLRDNNEALKAKGVVLAEDVSESFSSSEYIDAQLKELRNEYNELARRKEQIMSRFSPAVLAQVLQEKTNMSEREADAVADSYLGGELTTDVFTRQFFEMHKLAALRKLKLNELRANRNM